MPRIRSIYYPAAMIKSVKWLKIKNPRSDGSFVLGTPEEDFKITNLLKILFPLSVDNLTWTKLQKISGFEMRKKYNSYLRFLQERGFIEKSPVGNNKRDMFYSLTPDGREFLLMLS